jgi:hypothetical protein
MCLDRPRTKAHFWEIQEFSRTHIHTHFLKSGKTGKSPWTVQSLITFVSIDAYECNQLILYNKQSNSHFSINEMSTLLRGARVFSNETENNASVKQELTTNINVKVRGANNENRSPVNANAGPMSAPVYPTIGDINFTPPTAENDYGAVQVPHQHPSAYPSVPYNQPPIGPLASRSVDSSGLIDNSLSAALESKVKVLEALLGIYESAPILIKGCLIISQKKMIEIIQLLTSSDKVELLTEDITFGCCAGASSSLVSVSKIFVVDTNGNRCEFKVAFNSEYSLLLRHGLNLKLVRVE